MRFKPCLYRYVYIYISALAYLYARTYERASEYLGGCKLTNPTVEKCLCMIQTVVGYLGACLRLGVLNNVEDRGGSPVPVPPPFAGAPPLS